MLTIEEIFKNKDHQYNYDSFLEMNNVASMIWFLGKTGISEYIEVYYGTQIVLSHPDFDYKIQIDSGGRGDMRSHKFTATVLT